MTEKLQEIIQRQEVEIDSLKLSLLKKSIEQLTAEVGSLERSLMTSRPCTGPEERHYSAVKNNSKIKHEKKEQKDDHSKKIETTKNGKHQNIHGKKDCHGKENPKKSK